MPVFTSKTGCQLKMLWAGQEGANPDRELGRSGQRIYLGWLPRPPKKPAVLTPNPLHPLADAEGCLL